MNTRSYNWREFVAHAPPGVVHDQIVMEPCTIHTSRIISAGVVTPEPVALLVMYEIMGGLELGHTLNSGALKPDPVGVASIVEELGVEHPSLCVADAEPLVSPNAHVG